MCLVRGLSIVRGPRARGVGEAAGRGLLREAPCQPCFTETTPLHGGLKQGQVSISLTRAHGSTPQKSNSARGMEKANSTRPACAFCGKGSRESDPVVISQISSDQHSSRYDLDDLRSLRSSGLASGMGRGKGVAAAAGGSRGAGRRNARRRGWSCAADWVLGLGLGFGLGWERGLAEGAGLGLRRRGLRPVKMCARRGLGT